MKRFAMQFSAFIVLGLAGIAAAAEVEPPVPVNLEGVPAHLRPRIEAKASEGITALRQYLERTQNMHGIRLEHVVRTDVPPSVAKAAPEEGKLADAGKKAPK